ncbi:MAG: diaminopimelate epimerase [Muribaculaceae bacterium]|nr:diaminopimelate epimerase [Muribaculaceae bacterium]
MRFTKMHGIGNDFVVVDGTQAAGRDLAQLARTLCDRRRGIGADGLIAILPSADADCRMRIFNADGSEAQMCGNGIRCVGKYLYERLGVHKLNPAVSTMSGIKTLRLHVAGEEVESVTVDMGRPVFDPPLVPVLFDGARMCEAPVTTPTGTFMLSAVSTGNPHGVVFANNLGTLDIATIGPMLEQHPVWPERANIEFVSVVDSHHIAQRTWERGVGETEACGTGACAAAIVAVDAGRADYPVEVSLTGGKLSIDVNADGHILMTGPAATSFDGEWRFDDGEEPSIK